MEVGPAEAALARLPEEPHIDLAYVDADKRGYPAYYEALVPRMRPGRRCRSSTTCCCDGRVLDPQDERRPGRWPSSTSGSHADERVDSVLLGLSDGVTLARRREG